MLQRILKKLQTLDDRCVSVAEATEGQTAKDFIGPCFFAENQGNRYRVDTSEELSLDGQTAIITTIEELSPPPDWRAFSDQIPANILGAISSSPLATFIVSRITRLADGEVEWTGSRDRLIEVWNQSPPSLDQTQRDELTALAGNLHVPLSIDEDNLITAIA